VNVGDLGKFAAGAEIDAAALATAGLVSRGDRPVKILGEGELSVALKLRVDAVSASARTKIEAAGGSVEATAIPKVKKAPKVRTAPKGDAKKASPAAASAPEPAEPAVVEPSPEGDATS